MLLQASAVARIVGAEPNGGADEWDATWIDGASFDSRTIAGGELFVAVAGRRDGHDFVADAVARGASAVLCHRPSPGVEVPQIVVDDTVTALAHLARWCRDALAPSLDGRVVGITGSVGKTSTKDLLVAAISRDLAPVAASRRSFNNDLGVPVTIIGAPDDARALVLEMGMRGFGEISRLCATARPHVGVVTAVGDAHSEYVGGLEGVARAKSELVQALPADGVAVLNADDERVAAMSRLTPARTVTYGSGGMVSYSVESADDVGCCTADVVVSAELVAGGWRGRVRVPVAGAHMVSNACAAIAASIVLGVDPNSAVAGIEAATLSPGRMQWHTGRGGVRILDDSYNANPASMIAALETLASVDAGRRVAVLGLMAELADPAAAHREIARRAGELGIELIAVGTDLYGIAPVGVDEAVASLEGRLGADTVVLVKGSRVAGLERVVTRLVS